MHKSALWKFASVLLALTVWQVAALLLDEEILLASPIDVAKRLFTLCREDGFFASIGFTLGRIAGGFLLGLTLGCVLGAAAGKFRILEILLYPFVLTVKSVPVASFIVLALVWLSSATLSLFISFLMVLPVVYTNILTGIRRDDNELTQMAKVFSLTPFRRLLYIRLPQIKPFLLSACSLGLGLCWKAGIAAEVIGIPDGSMGERLYMAKLYLDTPSLLAWTVVIVLLSVLFEKLFLAALKFAFGRLDRI